MKAREFSRAFCFGQITSDFQKSRQAFAAKIFRLTPGPNQRHNSARLTHRGALAIVTNVRWDAVDARGARDVRALSVRRSRVVLMSRCWHQVRGRPGFSRATEAKEPFSGESTKQAVKPLRREGRDAPPVPVCSCARSLCAIAHETAGAACTRSSLRPLFSGRDNGRCKTRAKDVARRKGRINLSLR